ncbi:hypothetical protein CXG81DRAFT_16453 [Caulochytrium protostelioides]|uniref:SGNH hydrolase-type esterase domain-containing protein n=1 Tax=Caulochytrium protostelioides TaxID=1555241 RepID=A0A4P9XF26_9FUNG|nr:hypothetical protein CXG81DRAFT_16453 [Caulochytrium protostelioides]|eukprot:RKP04177.1 hypothetical protein CXG81DRAFT_16453 [Caulochytrium protostelioides]
MPDLQRRAKTRSPSTRTAGNDRRASPEPAPASASATQAGKAPSTPATPAAAASPHHVAAAPPPTLTPTAPLAEAVAYATRPLPWSPLALVVESVARAYVLAWYAALVALGHLRAALTAANYIMHVSPQTLPGAAYTHQLFVVGDELAMGYGDGLGWFAPPGVAQPLAAALRRQRHLRQNWIIRTFAHAGSTTRDWLDAGPRGRPRLLDTLAKQRGYPAARVVLVMLGANDYRHGIAPDETVANLERIAAEISAAEATAAAEAALPARRVVFVQTVPTYGDVVLPGSHNAVATTAAAGAMAETTTGVRTHNAALDAHMRIQEMLERYWSTPRDVMRRGIDLSCKNYEYNVGRYYDASNPKYLNAAGYKKLAADLANLIQSELTQIQFAQVSAQFDQPRR